MAAHQLSSTIQAIKRNNGWVIPLTFWLVASGFAFAHAYLAWGSYVASGVLRWSLVPRLFGALYAEFALAGVVVTWLYRRLWGRVAARFLTALLLLVNCAQLTANVYANEFLTSTVLRMAPLIGHVVSAGSAAIFGLSLFAAGVALAAPLTWSRWPESGLGARVFATVATAAWGVAMASSVHTPAVQTIRARYGLRPEGPCGSLVSAVRETLVEPAPSHAPNAAALAAGKQAGIFVAPDAPTPFRKDWVFRKPLPFAKRAGAATKPNVIVFFFESFSAEVLGPYNPNLRDVTPHLNDFASHAMRVDDYVNHTIPTVTGLRGQLCSMFPGLSYSPWKAEEKPRVGRVLCLPRLLTELGYESVYLNHGAATESHFDAQTIDWGFQRAYFVDGVLADLLGGESPGYSSLRQASDQQMMRATIKLLERLGHRQSAAPLFLAVSTIETHTGHRTHIRFGNGKNRVLNTFHNLDDAFGLFWSWYEHSAWAKDTILIVTGDHVLYPQDDLRKVATPRHLDSSFGYLGLFIMDPTHELPASFAVRASSLDFAPTLIQELGLPGNLPNPFMGLALFSDRQATPLALGLNYGTQLLVWDRRRDAPDLFPTKPESGRPQALFELLQYSQALEGENRLWLR